VPQALRVFSNRLIRSTLRSAEPDHPVVTAFPDGSKAFAHTVREGGNPFMLPGFRFLFAAIVLSTSMLIFGLGAAALLRAAHEEFASIPSRRAPPEVMFAQRDDAEATLAMVRIEPSATDQKAVIANSAPDQAAVVSAPPEPEKSAKESDKIATLIDAAMPAKDSLLSSTSEIPVQLETSAQDDSPSPAAETKLAPIAEVTPTASLDQVTATATNREAAPVDDSTRIAETRIATLGGPPVPIETRTPAKDAPAVVKKQAKRAVKQRRITRRAPVTLQASQKPADPFAQPIGR
jgi:hypothetical protein